MRELRKLSKINLTIIFIASFLLVFILAFLLGQNLNLSESNQLISPFISQEKKPSLPFLKYTIPNLAKYNYQASPELKLEKILSKAESYTAYLFSYTTTDKKMTGQINIPAPPSTKESNLDQLPVIVMLRGWVPSENYTTGTGTKNTAAVFANSGYVTIAPDFFGYGKSDSEHENSWETRFIKPINIIELIKTIQTNPQISFQHLSNQDKKSVPASLHNITLDKNKIGIWAHSNGGQIALTTLEVLSQTNITSQLIPTTLWAPVTAPFPYSVMFYTDEHEDEGKASRKWISMFEENYDVFDFSLTQHLDKLTGPIQIHHGTADEAALKVWSDEFVEKIEIENKRRENNRAKNNNLESGNQASKSTNQNIEKSSQILTPIEITYYTYPGANHNLQPGWNTTINRDVKFFNKWL